MFKLRDQLKTLKGRGLTRHLIEKFSSKEINLSPHESKNSAGEKLPGLENIGMGYVFEELIRKFNEENNEEAGEHFTPREIIKLMTFILFMPVMQVRKRGNFILPVKYQRFWQNWLIRNPATVSVILLVVLVEC